MRPLAIGVLAFATFVAGSPPAQAAPRPKPYIVVLNPGVDATAVGNAQGRALGFQPSLFFEYAFKGYAADLSESAVRALARNPQVQFIEPDGIMASTAQTTGNGILRIDADESSAQSGNGSGSVDINVAVLDDGIDASHPELNVAAVRSCLKNGRDPTDDRPSGWHGTAVGGFLAALDNDIGVVGVAPGARLWAVKVLDDSGFGNNSEVICGLDWVTSTRLDADPTNDIAVANMSLAGPAGRDTGSCPASKDAFHAAVCKAIAAGVVIVAAAGNESKDFGRLAPSTYDEVLTSTAMADRDGQPGGLGGAFMCDPNEFDDTPANFTNFATAPEDRAHTVAAPGTCIASLFPGGGFGAGSGTSFSTPHVAGVVALCIASGACAGLTAQQIAAKIVADAQAHSLANPSYGYEGDPLRPDGDLYYGYLVNAGTY